MGEKITLFVLGIMVGIALEIWGLSQFMPVAIMTVAFTSVLLIALYLVEG